MFDKILAARVLKCPDEEIQRVLGDFEIVAEGALYLLSRFVKPRPTIARMNALRAEVLGKGHSLARHGMHLGSEDLTTRLTKGTIAGVFSPSDQGFATSFASVFAYNLTRASAIDAMTTAYEATRNRLQPLIEAYDAALKVVKDMEAAGQEPKKERGNVTTARGKLQKECEKLTLKKLENLKNLDFMPVVFNVPKDVRSAIDCVKFPNRKEKPKLSFVMKHEFPVGSAKLPAGPDAAVAPSEAAETAEAKVASYRTPYRTPDGKDEHLLKIGQGMKVQTAFKGKHETVKNPKYAEGKDSKVWQAEQLEPMASLMGTKTTFNPPELAFSMNANPATWEVPQHFPDNGEIGWR